MVQNLSMLWSHNIQFTSTPTHNKECIPVGCVPAARRPYAGVCFPGGGSPWSRGGLSDPGGSAWSGGVSLVPGGVCLVQGGSAWSGGGGYSIPACTEADTLPPSCGQTHTCKNITLATTSLRPVIMLFCASMAPLYNCSVLFCFSWLNFSFTANAWDPLNQSVFNLLGHPSLLPWWCDFFTY